MRHRLLYQSAALVLDYDMVDDFLHARWGPDQTLTTTKLGYEQIITAVQPMHCHCLLDDRRESHLMWDELAEWMATDWYPRACQAGLTRHAVVFATDFFGHLATEKVLARLGKSSMTGYDSELAARRALLAR
ncbi:hypothetical protein [Hymenobacter canadensis]|uniref:Uncharacterized protein n=1 Tax=Hymenobacter canadensis TaxID=2999067 RepID=A0ABY7LYX8_9BACT|nr:hypothetical protein [Hymenobacter canadensis]WBA44153.1 hypothetical protein O3303_19890 [Hymenobacter canadensis]